VTLQPDGPWGRCERGDALRNTGRVEEALRDYDHVLALDPDYASAHASRGAALAALGRHEEALTALDRALLLNPAYTWALCRRAETHLVPSMPRRCGTGCGGPRDRPESCGYLAYALAP
jgi:tetratricopeptide (TPR) repeat protein